MMRVIAIVPCFCEAKMIQGIVNSAKRYVDVVIVADDNSTDDTVRLSVEAGALVVRNDKKGVGSNINRGMMKAVDLDADIVVTLDGDGQHNPDEIPKLIRPVMDDNMDFVIGSRFLQYYQMPTYRKIGIDIITWACNIFYKQKITDGQSCFRAYSKRMLKELVPIKEDGFAFSVETLIKAKAKGYKIKEIPVECIYNEDFKQNSTINPVKHGLKVLWGVLKWRIKVELMPRLRRAR
jgi:glycosyltransferase involved in cell wall biosynthesis